MDLYAERMWRMMSPKGRSEVIREFHRIAGRDPNSGWFGVSEEKITNTDDVDELPPDLLGVLMITAGPEGWEYHNYERIRGGGS